MEPRPLTSTRRGHSHPHAHSSRPPASSPSTSPRRPPASSEPPLTPRAGSHAYANGHGHAQGYGRPIGDETHHASVRQSWSSVTQDSVVDNLLSSLDRMAQQQQSDMADDVDRGSTPYTPPRALQRLQQRVRGHTYSSSVSHDSDASSPLRRNTDTNTLSTARKPSTDSQGTARNNHTPNHTHTHNHSLSLPSQGNPEVVAHSILDRGRPVPSVFSTYDAHCPQPIVPHGPRHLSDASQSTQGQRTVAPSSHTNPDIPQSIRDQAVEFVRQANMRASSPSSRQDYDGPKDKERPGFFRRVFGASARGNSSPDMQRMRENSVQSDNAFPIPVPTQTQQPVTTTTTTTMPSINKKASFFRRRKKSTSDVAPPPTPPAPQISPSRVARPFPASPGASSLKTTMDQYLGNSDTRHMRAPTARLVAPDSDGEDDDDDVEDEADDIDIFHSGYTPPPDASLRRPEPLEPRNSVSTKAATPSLRQKSFQSDQKLHLVTTNSPRPDLGHSSSFLADTSDADQRSEAPSVASVVSDTYPAPAATFSPVSSVGTPDVAASGASSPKTVPYFEKPLPSQISRQDSDYFVHTVAERPTSARDDRVWLKPSPSEEEGFDSPPLALPNQGRGASNSNAVLSARQPEPDVHLPVFQVDGNLVRPSVEVARGMPDNPDDPLPEERERAQRIYDGDEEDITRDDAAPWLGEKNPVSARTLVAYMSLFDFTGRNVLSSMRGLCDRLVLKGETQQVDRVLDAFSRRWNECNANNGFKGPNVVHAMCYALLLLNTDQHLADIQHKMTRSEFVKNTMPAIKAAAECIVVPNLNPARPTFPWQDSTSSVPHSPQLNQDDDEQRVPADFDFKRSLRRLSYRPTMGRFETDPGPGEHGELGAANHLVNSPFEGSDRGWFIEVEIVLKAFYTSIVADALPLSSQPAQDSHGPNNLTVNGGVLRRTGSVISKAPSEGFSYRSQRNNSTALSSRWHTKNRPRQKVYANSTVASSRTSFDDGQSAWSPSAQSSMWSKISMGRSQTTMSVESFAVHPDFKQSLGFTNALSQAIIREEGDNESVMKLGAVLEDESLELAGAPWAKEGMVKHKHHLEGPDKKAKERNWNECFAVVEKGYLHLFSFNRTTTKITNARSAKRPPGKAASIAPSVVGGGNWTDNAEELGQFLLRQTLATVLPSPGYSKARPHVWALSLPTGAVHLFQVGTAEIAAEFATTANYWSARLSKEPLIGGVDNIEYGWSENVINPALVGNCNGDSPSKPPSRGGLTHAHSNSMNMMGGSRPSMQSSVRGSFDQSFGSRSRTAGDRVHIADWKPPAASMLPSQLLEIDQLRSLRAYVAAVEAELEKHNELRNAVNITYNSKSGNNWSKVMTNWEKKSSYLLREVIKFSTYIEALEKAGHEKVRIYEERKAREEERATIASSKESTKESIAA